MVMVIAEERLMVLAPALAPVLTPVLLLDLVLCRARHAGAPPLRAAAKRRQLRGALGLS